MKESYSEGVANHADLRSYAAVREGGGGTLIVSRTGNVFSREISVESGRRRPTHARKATRTSAEWRAEVRPCEVRDPRHVRKHTARGLGDPMVVCATTDRTGKSKDVHR